MRVISGQFRGRRLKAVPNTKTRPTTDKVKESMFNILTPYLGAGAVLDMFAGSGALAIEAVSRGAARATLIERQGIAVKIINENIATTKAPAQFDVIKGDCFKVINRLQQDHKTYDCVFLDPPYKQQKIVALLTQVSEAGLLNDGAIAVCETDHAAGLPDEFEHFTRFKHVSYGITELSFYRYRPEGSSK